MFECQEGQARVHFHHTLHPPPWSCPPPHTLSNSGGSDYWHHHQSPSRLRQRARRALARVAATAAAADKSVNNVAPKNVNDPEKASKGESIEKGALNIDDAEKATVVQEEIYHK